MARRRGRAFVRLVVILLTLSSSSAEESGMSSMAGLSAPRSTRRMSTFVCAYFELRRLRSDNGLQGRDLSIRFRLLFRTKSSTKFQKRTTKDLQRFVVEEAQQMPEEPRINAIVHWQFKLLDRGPDHDPRPRPRPHPDPATARPTRVEARGTTLPPDLIVLKSEKNFQGIINRVCSLSLCLPRVCLLKCQVNSVSQPVYCYDNPCMRQLNDCKTLL